MIKFIFIIFVLLYSFINCQEKQQEPIYYTLDNLCEFVNTINDTDSYELYYVQAPLMYAIYGHLFEKINAFHSGVVLYNLNGGQNISADYYAGPNLVNALLPENITQDDQGNYNLTWNTYGLIEISNFINETYWLRRQLLMYDISGIQVKKFLSWLPIYNQTHPVYNLYSILNGKAPDNINDEDGDIYNKIFKPPITSNEIIYQKSSTCDDFVTACIESLYHLGTGFIGSKLSNPYKDEVELFTKVPPIVLDYNNNSTQRNEIANFYLNLINIANHKNYTVSEIFNKLTTLFNGTMYTYYNGVYYKLELASPPLFTYEESTMPSSIRNSSLIPLLDNCIIPKKTKTKINK